ncbi:hypothetical protein [Microbulbifer epialgicus]|uniref:Uncharacterized protein n=1 Tax=Microbulbifer epialgicus TaxID=393907 RepID=A0ABV4NY70_9GAMM
MSKSIFAADMTCVESDRCVAGFTERYFSSAHRDSSQESELYFVRSDELTGTLDQVALNCVPINTTSSNLSQNSTQLSARQFKKKLYLKDKSLLLFSEPHKRHSLAKLCYKLVQSSLRSPKILIGEFPQKNSSPHRFFISADDFLVDLNHFGVITVAVSQRIADELAVLSIPVIASESDINLKTTNHNTEIDYSLNSYLSKFIGGPSDAERNLQAFVNQQPKNQASVISSGISARKCVLNNSVLGAANRAGFNRVPNCAG